MRPSSERVAQRLDVQIEFLSSIKEVGELEELLEALYMRTTEIKQILLDLEEN